jgi:hypothetical protein
MRAQEADRAATRVGLVTVLIGAALAVAPQKMSRVLRFGDHARAVQVVGLADMALVPGLVFAQRKGNWMAARAALNLLIAAYCTHLARKEDLQGPKIGAVAMLIATITDAPAILTLHAHDRNS